MEREAVRKREPFAGDTVERDFRCHSVLCHGHGFARPIEEARLVATASARHINAVLRIEVSGGNGHDAGQIRRVRVRPQRVAAVLQATLAVGR